MGKGFVIHADCIVLFVYRANSVLNLLKFYDGNLSFCHFFCDVKVQCIQILL